MALAKDEELRKRGGCVPALQDVLRCPMPSHFLKIFLSLSSFAESLSLFRCDQQLPTFHPEFGRFMLEATPGKPWGIEFKDLLDVERNMRWR